MRLVGVDGNIISQPIDVETVSGLDVLSEVVNDTTPQLGGPLSLNSNNITGTGNISITGQLTASSTSIPATLTRSANDQSPTMVLEKDVGSGGDMSRRSSMLYAVKNNTTTKYLGLTAWDDDATLGKTMRVRSLSDDATSGTDIAFFSGTSVDFQGDITVGGSGASVLQSSGNFEIDCGSDDLTITAGDIIATLDGGTY